MIDGPSPATFVYKSERPEARLATILLDGQDIGPFVRHVDVQAHLGELIEVRVTLWARLGLDLSVASKAVRLQATVLPGFVLIEEPQPDGSIRWRTERQGEDS